VGKRKGKPKRVPEDSADVGINTVSETYWLHVGKRKGKPKRVPEDSADVGINTVSETYWLCASAAKKFRNTARLPAPSA